MQQEIILNPTIDINDSLNDINHKIHISIKQRNARKSTTTIENLPQQINLDIFAKKMRQKFHCSGSVQKGDNGKYIKFSGDQRAAIKKFLMELGIANEENIVVHGWD